MGKEISSTPSVFLAIRKLTLMLTREEKAKWIGIIALAVVVSFLEIITASIIVVFAQVLNDPSSGEMYFRRLGFDLALTPNQAVLYIAFGVGGIYLIKNLVAGVEVFFQTFSIQKMCYDFKNKLLYRYSEADYGSFMTRNSSFGLQVVGGDAEQAFSGGMISIASVLSELIVFISLVGMIIYMNPFLALIVFVVGFGFSLLITKFLFPRFYRWGKSLQEAGVLSTQVLMQFFHAFKEIILSGKKSHFIDSYKIYSKQRSRMQAAQTATNALPRMAIEAVFVSVFVLTVAYLCTEAEEPVQMIGLLSGYLYTGFRLMPGLNRIINQLNVFKSVIPSIERVYAEYTGDALTQYHIDIPEYTFKESIVFKDVFFRYIGAENNALSFVNLEIKKGEKIGIIGPTGSGKSTLVDLLLGLLIPSKGNILVDSKYPVNSSQWHEKIGYVPQSIYLIDDTIEANIVFGQKNIDIVKLNEAIDMAQLRDFVNFLPEGTKTFVGERGIRLSGGERQRVAIARALYREPEVIVFDEATSALDHRTEAKLMQTIERISKNRTIIMIAHRLSTLKDCDRIVEINDGNINVCNQV